MNLQELVRLRENVQNLTIAQELDCILNMIKTFDSVFLDYTNNSVNQIRNEQQTIIKSLEYINNYISNICTQLQTEIDSHETECNQKNQAMYNEGLQHDTPEYLLDKNLDYFNSVPEENKQLLLNRINTHLNWAFPALEIRPGNMAITNQLVAHDPLYLVDTCEEMFSKVKASWNSIYQNRVRYYTINEPNEQILEQLPNNQFGLVICTNFFDRRPLEIINQYLQEIYNKLRPGGSAIFTFNDCDYPEGIDNFNNIYYCYTPGHTIISMCTSIGYIIAGKFKLNQATTWLEIQKPGELSTIRSAPTLGKIENI